MLFDDLILRAELKDKGWLLYTGSCILYSPTWLVFVIINKPAIVYTVNKVVYNKHHFTTSNGMHIKQSPKLLVSIWKIHEVTLSKPTLVELLAHVHVYVCLLAYFLDWTDHSTAINEHIQAFLQN